MGHMSRWGADLAGLQCRILLPCRPLYPTLFYTMPPRSILSRCSTRHPSNRESISRRFATPFIPCAPPTRPLTTYHIVLFIPSRHLPLFPLPPYPLPSHSTSFHLFPSLPISPQRVPYHSIPFHTLSKPFHTPSTPFPYPFHTAPSSPIFSHLCSPRHAPFRSIPFHCPPPRLLCQSTPLHLLPHPFRCLLLSARVISTWIIPSAPLQSRAPADAEYRRKSRIGDHQVPFSPNVRARNTHFLSRSPTASPDFGAIQLTDTPINGPNGSRLTAK